MQEEKKALTVPTYTRLQIVFLFKMKGFVGE